MGMRSALVCFTQNADRKSASARSRPNCPLGAAERPRLRCSIAPSREAGFSGGSRVGDAQLAVTLASQTISDRSAQAELQALNDGLVAAITLLNKLRAAVVEKGLVKGAEE